MHEQSRPLMTFLTQWELDRGKRLVLGVSCAREKFQRAVIIYVDDILICESSIKEHDECLMGVLSILEKRGVMLNVGKCKISKQEVVILGRELMSEGIDPTEEETLVIRQFRAP